MTEKLLSTLELVGNPCAVWLHAENCPAWDGLMRQIVSDGPTTRHSATGSPLKLRTLEREGLSVFLM